MYYSKEVDYLMINKTNGFEMKQRKDHDHQAKIMLSNKQILAHVIRYLIIEFKM